MDYTKPRPCPQLSSTLPLTVTSCKDIYILPALPAPKMHTLAHVCPFLGQERPPLLKARKASLDAPWGLKAFTPRLNPLQVTGRSAQNLLPYPAAEPPLPFGAHLLTTAVAEKGARNSGKGVPLLEVQAWRRTWRGEERAAILQPHLGHLPLSPFLCGTMAPSMRFLHPKSWRGSGCWCLSSYGSRRLRNWSEGADLTTCLSCLWGENWGSCPQSQTSTVLWQQLVFMMGTLPFLQSSSHCGGSLSDLGLPPHMHGRIRSISTLLGTLE